MATRRLPPAHAPAHGRRRQEGGQPPGQTNRPGRTNATDGPGRGNATDGTAPGRRVGQQREAAQLTTELAETPSSSDDRARKRRRTEEEYRLYVSERREVVDRSRRRVFRSLNAQLEDRTTDHRHTDGRKNFREAAPDRRAPSAPRRGPRMPALRDAARAFERSAEYLTRGLAPEASFALTSEAANARSAALDVGSYTEVGHVLTTMADHMEAHADAFKSMPPGQARKLAAALDRMAATTVASAEDLRPIGAKMLSSVATDTRALAAMLRIGASNDESFLGRGLLRAGHEIADRTFDLMKKRAVPPLGNAAENKAHRRDLKRAVANLDRALDDLRLPLHGALDKTLAKSRVRGVDTRTLLSNLATLGEHDLTRDLMPSLKDLSQALADGEPRDINRVRSDLMRKLLHHPRLSAAIDSLDPKLPVNPKLASAAAASEQLLPAVLLHGLLRGQLADVLKPSSTNPITQWMRNARPDAPPPSSFTASEQILVDMIGRGRDSWPAQALGASEHMLQGSYGWLRTTGEVSQVLQHAGMSGVQPHVTTGSANALASLPPVGPYENSVLVDRNGVVLVRSDDGPRFHQGHVVDTQGERHYFDTYPVQPGLQRVEYQSAADPTQRRTRLEVELQNDRVQYGMPVQAASVESIEAPPEDEESAAAGGAARRTWQSEGGAFEDLAAVVVFRGTPDPAGGFQGVTTRHLARLAADEIDRINHPLPNRLKLEYVYLESAAEGGAQLADIGLPHTDVFQEHIDLALLGLDCNPAACGLLILLATAPDGAARAADILEELGAKPKGSYIRAGSNDAESFELGRDRNRDTRLLGDGVLLHTPGAVVTD